MLTTPEKVLFILLLLFVLGAAYTSFERMYRAVMRGEGELRLEDLPQRLLTGAKALFSQGEIIRNRRTTSLIHWGVAWGFLFYFLVNAADVVEGFVPNMEETFWGVLFRNLPFRFLADIFSVIVLAGVAYFLIRRFIQKDPALATRENVKLHPKARAGGISRDSLLVGLFILLHVGARLVSQSFLVAQHGADWGQPFATLLSNLWNPATANVGWHISWWVALGLILLFLPYFPYTKHAHLFMGPINFMTRPERAALGAMNSLDFEDETIEQFGAATLPDLPKTAILDAFACIMCNRCQEACPAYVTGKELSPSAIEVNKRYYLKEHLPAFADGALNESPLLDYAISDSALWACTSCAACIEVCPVGNEPMHDILNMRRDQVLMNSAFPDQLKGAFTGMERTGNPWSMTDDRMAWAQPLPFEVPTVAQNPDFEVLYWVGCAGSFDPHAQEIARATATVLHHAGINFAVLGEQESCTGDSARRAGNEYLFFEMAQANIETLNSVGADKKRIVATCPHCFMTLGTEYAELGGEYRVLHHTQLIADLIGKGKLTLKKNNRLEATFHDPCYLGRHSGEYKAPREALANAGITLLEMDRNREGSFCCGAGGAQFWKEEEHGEEAVSHNRFAEAAGTGAKVVATGCPFCARMLGDAKTDGSSQMEVKDVAELVAAAI